jgi:hypothetical protein
VKTTGFLLPEAVRGKAAISAGGEHAWRQHGIEDVLREAVAVGLGCLRRPGVISDTRRDLRSLLIEFRPAASARRRAWSDYVSRSSHEALEGFRRLSGRTNLGSVVREWESIRTTMDREDNEPLDDLAFALDFATNDDVRD